MISLEYARTNDPMNEHLDVTNSLLSTSSFPIKMSVSEFVMNAF